MPYYTQSPLDVGLGAAGAFLSAQQQKKQLDLQNKMAEEQARQQAALTAAQIQTEQQQNRALYGTPTGIPQAPQPTKQRILPQAPLTPKPPATYKATSNRIGGRQATATYSAAPPKAMGTVTATAQVPETETQPTFQQQRAYLQTLWQTAMSQGNTGYAQRVEQMAAEIDKNEQAAQVDSFRFSQESEKIRHDLQQEKQWSKQDDDYVQRTAAVLTASLNSGSIRLETARMMMQKALEVVGIQSSTAMRLQSNALGSGGSGAVQPSVSGVQPSVPQGTTGTYNGQSVIMGADGQWHYQ